MRHSQTCRFPQEDMRNVASPPDLWDISRVPDVPQWAFLRKEPIHVAGFSFGLLFARLELGLQQKKSLFCLVSGKQRDPKKAKNKKGS